MLKNLSLLKSLREKSDHLFDLSATIENEEGFGKNL